jgi:ribose 5-phosphate isomerase B
MRVAIAFDHAGVILRPVVIGTVAACGGEIMDCGTDSTERVDYVPYAFAAADAVSSGQADRAIICCGTGLGSCIAASKVRGVRAVTISDTYSARMSRLHNDANCLCLGGRVVGSELARDILTLWLETPFSDEERHRRRIIEVMAREG